MIVRQRGSFDGGPLPKKVSFNWFWHCFAQDKSLKTLVVKNGLYHFLTASNGRGSELAAEPADGG